jgi:tetratricopeptide (TPR) repeat protein
MNRAIVIRASLIAGFIIASPALRAQPVLDLPAAQDLLRRGDTLAAIRQLRAAEARHPNHAPTLLLLSYAYYLAGQKKLFAATAARAATLDPDNPDAPYSLGRYYLDDLQRADLAAAEFRRALARNPAHPPSLYHLGWCLELDKQPDAAAPLYRQAAAANYWLAHLGLARLSLDQGELERALEHVNTALRLHSDSPQPHLLLARIHQRSGHHSRAIPPLQKAVALDPTDAAALYQLARAARAAGLPHLERETLLQYDHVRKIYSP